MEYSFAEVHGKEIFRSSRSGLTGTQVLVENYDDCVITHRFKIDGIVKSENGFTWYNISGHSTVVDKSEVLKVQIKEQSDALVELAEIIDGMMGE